MKALLLCLLLTFPVLHLPAAYAQDKFQTEGLWEGYDGEWGHVSQQLVALAEAIPAEKYCVASRARCAIGERSLHAYRDREFLSVERHGAEDAGGYEIERSGKDSDGKKADVIDWLKRSLAAVKTARAEFKPGELERKVKIEGKDGHRRRDVSADHRPRQRAHGAVDRLCAHERDCAAVVEASLDREKR